MISGPRILFSGCYIVHKHLTKHFSTSSTWCEPVKPVMQGKHYCSVPHCQGWNGEWK